MLRLHTRLFLHGYTQVCHYGKADQRSHVNILKSLHRDEMKYIFSLVEICARYFLTLQIILTIYFIRDGQNMWINKAISDIRVYLFHFRETKNKNRKIDTIF